MKRVILISIAICLLQGKGFSQVVADSLEADSITGLNKDTATLFIDDKPIGERNMYTYQTVTPQQRKWRMPLVFGTVAGLYAGSFIGLNQLWYANYPQSSFHFFDDNAEWMGLDKFGHATTAYYIGYYTQPAFQWTGMSRNASVWTAGALGFAYQGTIEIFDGFSAEYGASWGDLLANFGGSAMFVSQELLWKEQRFMLKLSYFPSEYAAKRPDLLGSNFAEQVIKDYNAHTFWLSCNIWSFLPNREASEFPRWLNVAVGYGANGLLGGFTNPPQYANVQRYQQFYISIDFDLTKIKTKSKFLRALFKAISIIKFPAPAIEFTTNPGQPVVLHWLMF